MAYLLGIDIGTSGTKILAIDETGKIIAGATEEYPLSSPRPLWAEQNAADWWNATQRGVARVLAQVPAEKNRRHRFVGTNARPGHARRKR